MRSDEEGLAPEEEKLIPEWSVDADDQIIVLGLVVVAAFLALFGWNAIFGGDDTDAATTDPAAAIVAPVANAGADLPEANSTNVDADVQAAAPTTTVAPTTTQAPTTTVPAPVDPAPEVATAIAAFASASSDVANGTATLTGFVGTEADKTSAGDAAAAVAGVTSVDNQLVVVQPGVLAALDANGVTGAEVEMMDTSATVRGEIPNEEARMPALEAALAVPGVSAVIDELSLPAAEATIGELNALFELEPIQFASNSADILPESFGTLDQAAAILEANAAAIDVQGYTDVLGPDVTNLTLSQARADAVVAYLVSKGVNGENLSATGYGETSQFGEGETPEALAANRRVRFELI